MASIYFDVTDIVHFATRYSRVTGIQRVQLNIITLLARKYGTDIACTFFDESRNATRVFRPAHLSPSDEFDADVFLSDLGLLHRSNTFPSKTRIKSHLRFYANRKILRALKKVEIYGAALLWPSHLQTLGLAPEDARRGKGVVVETLAQIPKGACFVCMGSTWLAPQVWEFAAAHRDRGGDVVQMAYDMIPIVHPEYYAPKEPIAYRTWLDAALLYAARFMCISAYTAKDLSAYAAQIDRKPVTEVVPLAHEFSGFTRTATVEPPQELTPLIGRRFVVCVGTIEHRKNCVALLKVWQQLLAERTDALPLLVFAGKYGKGSEHFQDLLSSDKGLAAAVLVVNSPSDRGLAWLYRNCLFNAFPSTYEGWGLPVGEAAWFGKYTVASQATSIPEVCGDLLDYVDPTSIAEIKAAVVRAENDEFRLERERRIAASDMRTWNDVADHIYRCVTQAA